MASDWEKLAGDFASITDALIAEVDCTEDENDKICSENDVKGFPTLKYGNPSAMEDYQGGRDYESLKSFADENLKPSCSPFNIELCEGEQKAMIESFTSMSVADLQAKVDAVDAIVEAADEEFEAALEKLQETYETMQDTHDTMLEDEKNKTNYKMIKAVMAFKNTEEKNDEL
jgi:cellobiose-specific phosphotransferase system component IIA